MIATSPGIPQAGVAFHPEMDAGAETPTRVAIAGGRGVVRGAVRLSCVSTPGVEVVAETEDAGSAVVDLCADIRPDLLVLAVDGVPGDGLDGLRGLRERGLDTPVLILSDRRDGPTVLDALKLGVRGYLDTAEALRSVGTGVKRIMAGERLVDADLEQAAVVALGTFARRAREGSEMASSLTRREQQILSMISQGLTTYQVGTRLGISPRTVESHVAKLYRKLGVRTRVQAVSRAAQLGLLDLR